MIRIVAVLATIMLGYGAAAAESVPSCDGAGIAHTRRLRAHARRQRDKRSSPLADYRRRIGVLGALRVRTVRVLPIRRVEEALRARLPGHEIAVTTHIQPRETTAEMAAGLHKILADDKPTLVIWQAGTIDALHGVEPEDFRTSLDQGLDAIAAGGADVIMMNMQYSPRTESMLGVTPMRTSCAGSRSSAASCCSTVWRSCATGARRGLSTSMRRPRIMLWLAAFTNALAGPWRRRSSMGRISTPRICKQIVDVGSLSRATQIPHLRSNGRSRIAVVCSGARSGTEQSGEYRSAGCSRGAGGRRAVGVCLQRPGGILPAQLSAPA